MFSQQYSILLSERLIATASVYKQIYEKPNTTYHFDKNPHVTMPKHLERSYTIANISSYEKEVYSNHEAPTDQDNDVKYIEESHGYADDLEYADDFEYADNNDPTPKKKRKSNVGQQINVANPMLHKVGINMGKELDHLDLKTKMKKKSSTVREQVNAWHEKTASDKPVHCSLINQQNRFSCLVRFINLMTMTMNLSL